MPPQHKCAFVEGGQPKLSELTGLTAARAAECLAENSNDLVTSLASFVQNFKTLPADYFADANKAKTAATDINTMVGLAYDAVSAVMEAERLDDADEGKCWKALAAAKWDVKKASASLASHAASAVAAPAGGASMENRYTGSFMTMPRFQQAEIAARATIFNMDKGFMASTNEAQLRERMLKWVAAVPAFRRVPLKYPAIPNYDENTVRVIVRDAERTFFDPEHRRKFQEFLHAMWKDLGTYGQAMSYLAAVCLLALTEEETAFILRKVALDYIPGHWKNEADGFATNAWVIEHFFQEKFPDVAAHFKKFHFTPEMYMQKILSGLCVHVLPFKYMFQFLDNFLVKGFEYLVRFELAVVQHLKPKLLAINDPQKMHELFELMRLDINTIDLADIEAILAGAAAMQVDTSDVDVLRSRMYDEKVLPKLEAAKAAPPEFDPCTVCDKDEPTLFCEDCDIPICASCAKKPPHNKHSHTEY